jgi:dihydroneopterin aldolase
MSSVIEIRGLRCEAIVGVLEQERRHVQPISFDIDMVRPFTESALHDDVNHTTNYATVTQLACAVALDGKFHLLETLATRVGEVILALDAQIESVTVGVRKLRPPVLEDVKSVGVRRTLTRS